MASVTHPYRQPPRDRMHQTERGRTRTSRSKLPPHLLHRVGARSLQPAPNHLLRALIISLVLLPVVVGGTGAAGGWGYYSYTAAQLRPRLSQLAAYKPFATSRIFSRDGTLLYEYVTQGRRDPVALKDISPLLVDGTVAIEDKNFWTNPGVDYVGIVRSALLNAQSDENVSGASTITQQFIKLVVLTDAERKQTYQRKLKEAVLAQELTQEYAKQEIMQLYLNEVNYGNRNYGIQAASQGFFGVNAKDLSLSQAALLAGLPQSPTVYNPVEYVDENNVLHGVPLKPGWLNPSRPLPNGTTRPRVRQVDVLRQLVLTGVVKEADARAAAAEDLKLVERNKRDIENQQRKQLAPHFVDYVVDQLENDPELGPILKNEGGLTITTTIDLRFQKLAQQEVKRSVDQLVRENGNLNNAATVIEQPHTGQILAMVGSIDYNTNKATKTPGQSGNVVDGQVNVAARERQPGSSLKPFVYLAAMENKILTPGSIIWDVDTRWPQKDGATLANINSCVPDGIYWYCPRDYDQKWHGPLRMREALANSLNIPALIAINNTGVPKAIDVLHRAGITTLNRNDYGIAVALGGGEVKLVDLTTAYNTLANDGQYVAPTTILKITDRNGAVVREPKPQGKQVIDPKLVAIMRDIMSDNVARYPIFGRGSTLELSRPAAVKTGTTNDYRDAWAMGFTPYVTVGVWGGNNNNERTNAVAGSNGGGLIWNRIMESIFKDKELDRFLRGTNDVSTKAVSFPPLTKYGLVERPMCALGGSFGLRSTEWFAPNMPAPQTSQPACTQQDSVKVSTDSGAHVVGNTPFTNSSNAPFTNNSNAPFTNNNKQTQP